MILANQRQSAIELLGAPVRPASRLEIEMCPGKCGEPIRFAIGAFGALVQAPCVACARRGGKPQIAVVRRTVADVERDLADVLLYYSTKWGPKTSKWQRAQLKQRVDALLAQAVLPPLEPAGWQPPAPARPPRPQHAEQKRAVAPTRRCATCGDPLPRRPGRPSDWCPAHRPKRRPTSAPPLTDAARLEAQRRSGQLQGSREHRCACGFMTRGNVAWGMHRKRCTAARGAIA